MTTLLDTLGIPYENHLLPFLWQQGNHRHALRRQLAEVQACGIEAICLESRTHEDFCGEGWWADLDLILDEAEKRGMGVWVLDDKHFPSGFANDFIDRNNRRDLKRVTLIDQHVDVIGPSPDATLVLPMKLEFDDELLAVFAYPRTEYAETLQDAPIDLAANVKGGLLHWDIPEGLWRIFFIFKTRGGTLPRHQNYIDMLSQEGVDVFLNECYEPHHARYARYFGRTFRGFFSDEPAFLNTWGRYTTTDYQLYDNRPGRPGMAYPWHDTIGEGLRELYGDDWKSRLPALWFQLGDATAKIRFHYMDLLTKRYRDNFVRRIGDWCRARHVEYIGHVIEDQNTHGRLGYGTGHYFRSEDGQSMSGMDIVLHQVMPGMGRYRHSASSLGNYVDGDFFHCVLPKMCASAAVLDSRTKGRAMCEVFGAYGWAEGVPFMKQLMDFLLVRGINQFVPHAFSPSFPNPDCPPHFGIDGHDPQQGAFGELMRYTNGVASLLQGGEHVADVAMLYHAEAEWGTLDDSQRMLMQEPARQLMDAHIDFDIVPADALLESACVEDGCLRVRDRRYRALVIPGTAFLPESLCSCLQILSQNGFRPIFIDRAPSGLGGAELVSLDGLPERLCAAGCQDVAFEGEADDIVHYHVRKDGMDIFFVVNESPLRPAVAALRLPVAGPHLQLDFHAGTAYAADCPDGRVALALQPSASLALVFGASCQGYPQRPCQDEARALTPVFDIALTDYADLNTFTPYRTTDKLFNICGAGEKPDFSGQISYSFTADLSAGKTYELDLGEVGQVASLEVNGHILGWRYCRPYRFILPADILRDGGNDFRVIVANTLGNALKDPFSFYLQIPRSGLFGPLVLTAIRG